MARHITSPMGRVALTDSFPDIEWLVKIITASYILSHLLS